MPKYTVHRLHRGGSLTTRMAATLLFASLVCCGASAWAQTQTQTAAPQPFGSSEQIPFALKGAIYFLPQDTDKLPDFSKLKPVGSIYTDELNVPSRSFDKGFPGVTDRFEWFAIDYTGKMLISRPAKYRFRITSDDGSRVYIDDKLLIDNDGVHPARTAEGGIDLAPGLHRIRVSYFQGPRYEVALVLEVAAGSEPYRPFRAKAFAPVEMSESHGQLKIELPEAILFDFDQYDLKPAAVSVLAEVEESVLSKRPASKLLVGGYTDDVGADSYNLDLSRRRAESVAGWLRQHGIAAERLQVEGYGSQSPKVPNTSAGNRARNRRVEIFVR